MHDDLTCWDYAPEFTGQQAALAIIGSPNTETPEILVKTLPVINLMRRSYEGTRQWLSDAHAEIGNAPLGLLESIEMKSARNSVTPTLEAVGASDIRLLTWLRTPMADFERQHFSRDVLAHWILEVGALTKYPFTTLATTPVTSRPLQRTAAQEQVILDAIRSAGYDPQHLPKNQQGKPGIKMRVSELTKANSLFTGTTVFNKAWERMRNNGDIANET